MNKMDKKECNTILQQKLSKVTNVLPKDQEKNDNDSEKQDVVDTVRPFFALLQVLGLQQMTIKGHEITPTSRWLKLYSFLIASTIFGIQLALLIIYYTKPSNPSEPQNPSKVVTELLKIVPPSISAIICMFLSSTSYQEMMIRVLNNFKITDKQLDIQSKNIYTPLRNKAMFIVAVITIGTVAMYICDYLYFGNDYQFYMTGLVMFINDYVLMEVCLLLYVVKTRLDALNIQLNATKYETSKIFNKELSIISKKKDLITMSIGAPNFPSAKKIHENERTDDLIRLMKIYDRLADNANIVNSCFGIPLLSSAVTTFMVILSTVSSLIDTKTQNEISDDMENAEVAVWCLRHITVVVLVTIVIEIMMSSVKKTSNIINKLSICPNIDSAREELLDRFSQLITCRKFTITACNFFPFDFTFIYSLVGAVATYTVILLQVNPGTPKPKT